MSLWSRGENARMPQGTAGNKETDVANTEIYPFAMLKTGKSFLHTVKITKNSVDGRRHVFKVT
jgi:hypothetical protein